MRIGKHGLWEPEPRTPSKEESTSRKECKAGDVVSFKDDSYIVKDDGETCTELCDEHEKEFNEYLTSHDIQEIREIWKKAGCDHMLKRPPIPEKGWVQACCYCTKQVDFPVKCTIDGKIVAMSDSCSNFKLMQA